MGSGEPYRAIEAPAAGRGRRTATTLALTAAILVALVLVGVLVARAGVSNTHRDRALARERHSYEVMLAARSVEASMASAEAALGRFSISADRLMGSTYYADWTLAGAQIDKLRTLVGNDPVEVRLVARLSQLYASRGRELGRPAAHAFRHEGDRALTLFNATGRSQKIVEIDTLLETLRAHELATLERRYDQSDAAAADATSLVTLLSLTGLALLAAAGGLAWAVMVAIGRRRRAEAAADDAADRADWLRAAVTERTRALSDANARLEAEIGERAVAEAQLHQMQKMEAVGQLTGGIAHDFNNMLAVVVGGLELARRRLPTGHTAAEHIDRALDGASRAAALTRRLLGFARAEPLLPEHVDPCALIAGMSELIDRSLGERVAVETRVDPGCWPVFVDPLQLENAILNLAVNGRDAMESGGRIVIAAGNVALTDDAIGTLAAGDYARIEVSDDGRGMTPEILARVFEPFFTTKPAGQGTGLGLSQIFGFARQSGGDVAIRSAPGTGTTVTLYLPRAAARVLPARASAEIVPLVPPAPPPSGRPVLLVEDDPRVRISTAGALEELGYTVTACECGADALTALAVDPTITVMVSDVVMPGMTGPELAATVRERHPQVAILFVTGYAGEDGGELIGEALLRKPFTVAALERATAEAFARAGANAPGPATAVAAAG